MDPLWGLISVMLMDIVVNSIIFLCFLFSHYQFSFYLRPTEPSPKWGDEYPTLNEVYNTQTNQRASVIPVQTAGSRNLTKSSQVQDQKRNRSLPSLFPDEGTLHNSTTLTGMYVFNNHISLSILYWSTYMSASIWRSTVILTSLFVCVVYY